MTPGRRRARTLLLAVLSAVSVAALVLSIGIDASRGRSNASRSAAEGIVARGATDGIEAPAPPERLDPR